MCSRCAPLRSRQSSAPCSRRSVMTAFQRATTMANFISCALRSPSSAMALPRSRLLTLPERDRETGHRLDGKEARLPVRVFDGSDARFRGVSTGVVFQPMARHLMDGVERSDFDKQVGSQRGQHAVDEFKIAQGARKGRPLLAAPSFRGGSSQPCPGSKPSAEKKLTSSSN